MREERSEARAQIRPMPLPLAVASFGLPCLLFLALQQWLVPSLAAAGVPLVICFLILGTPHLLFFFGALIAYRAEGWPWQLECLATRFRFHSLGRRALVWTVAAVVGNVGSYVAVHVLAGPLVERLQKVMPAPEVIGEILGDARTFAGIPLAGNIWLLGVFFAVYVFNVMGEELWWRGCIFPRQELTHGRHTWLVHGLLWSDFHLFSPASAFLLLPGALWVSWIVQREKNTWIFVVAHATLNGLAMIRIVQGVFG